MIRVSHIGNNLFPMEFNLIINCISIYHHFSLILSKHYFSFFLIYKNFHRRYAKLKNRLNERVDLR
jgi:hypothetical protein